MITPLIPLILVIGFKFPLIISFYDCDCMGLYLHQPEGRMEPDHEYADQDPV